MSTRGLAVGGGFASVFRWMGNVVLPPFTGKRIMMMPLVLGDLASVPPSLNGWKNALNDLFALSSKEYFGRVAYFTLDERRVKSGDTHRRSGLHVDGVFRNGAGPGSSGPWAADDGAWGSRGGGMITVASHPGCRAWLKDWVRGVPGPDGECAHLSDQFDRSQAVEFGAGEAFWLDGLCVHESVPQLSAVNRQFVRLSMPSRAPWFEGYTVNPLGVRPTGPILPRRQWMEECAISAATL